MGLSKPLLARLSGGLLLLLTALPAPAAVPDPPPVDAGALYMMEARTGRVLASRHANRREPPASLAKLMTALLTFEALGDGRLAMTDRVRIGKDVWRMDGSQMFLEVGERVPVHELLTGMVVAGANDAARALAQDIGGSLDTFVDLMNRRARRLGMDHTRFANASGMPAPGMHTTARDMAILARALRRRFPGYMGVFDRERISHNGITQRADDRLPGADGRARGLLTGHVAGAGYHLAATAEGEGTELIAVVLGSPDPRTRLAGMQALLSYGLRSYRTVRPVALGEEVRSVRVWEGQREHVPVTLASPLWLTVPRHRAPDLAIEDEMDTPVRAPVKTGQTLGWLRVSLDGRNLAHRPLVAASPVAAGGWLTYLSDEIRLQWRDFWREQRRSLLADDRQGRAGGGRPPG
ncbi:MAG TPA: D-alanyl-D-alanine carboxypeptidase family protein [Gammaproteobacteria bacterium]|nr:D-alanyl-D-alanine carboxypeptidase family protein [Gammaproteobacteria bacterium]